MDEFHFKSYINSAVGIAEYISSSQCSRVCFYFVQAIPQ